MVILCRVVADRPRECPICVSSTENTAWSGVRMRLQQVLGPVRGSKNSTGCVRDKQ